MAYRLTLWEKKRISELRKIHMSWRKIWEILHRDHTVVMREYNRNKKRWWHYDPIYAHLRSKQRKYYKKKQCKTIRLYNVLESYIIHHLKQWRRAETIAGRWNSIDKKESQNLTEEILPSISWSSIRRYLNSKYSSNLKYILEQKKLLKHYKKKAEHGKREWWRIKFRVFINDRPIVVWNKQEWWHCEADFIESIRDDSSVILTIIEKVSRERRAIKLPNKNSEIVLQCLQDMVNTQWFKSITFDNDTSFALHYKLSIPTYFCHTYSSREKWQVERWNRWYRKFFPKKTEIKNLSQGEIDRASRYLNDYPLKCLDYKTPSEVYNIVKDSKVKGKINIVVQ